MHAVSAMPRQILARSNRTYAVILFVCLASGVVTAQTFTEGFTGGSNEGGWSYGTGNGVIESTGGNPGYYFHDPFVDSFAPQPHTEWGSDSTFTGDYRARQVTSVGIDLILHAVDFSADGRPLSLLLLSDNNTPSDFDDDWAAYTVGQDNIPLPGQGWLNYEFAIPSQSTQLPADWRFLLLGINAPANPDWNDVITDVDQLRYWYHDPEFFAIFQGWNTGMDNVSITTVPEPATMAMMGLGALAASFRHIRRTR